MAYERVWGLLVDGAFEPGLEPGAPVSLPVHSGDARVDLQAALALFAASAGLAQLIDIDAERARDELAANSASAAWRSTRASPLCTGSDTGAPGSRPGSNAASTSRPHTRS